MISFHSAMSFALCLIGFSVPALAAGASPSPTAVDALSKLHHSNQMEIEMGKLAQRKGATEGVRDYGKMLVTDHSAADEKVTALAKRERMVLHDPHPKDAREAAEQKTAQEGHRRLDDLSGSAFDAFFLQMMKADHEHDIRDVQTAARQLKGTATGDLLAQVLPTLQKHLRHAEDVSAGMQAR